MISGYNFGLVESFWSAWLRRPCSRRSITMFTSLARQVRTSSCQQRLSAAPREVLLASSWSSSVLDMVSWSLAWVRLCTRSSLLVDSTSYCQQWSQCSEWFTPRMIHQTKLSWQRCPWQWSMLPSAGGSSPLSWPPPDNSDWDETWWSSQSTNTSPTPSCSASSPASSSCSGASSITRSWTA